jgi:transposase, IS5 family
VVETNIHFPTDLNLLFDSLRKGVETVGRLCIQDKTIKGWRKYKSIISDLKSLFRTASHKVFRGRNEAEKIQSVRNYLHKARGINKRLIAAKEITTSIVAAIALEQYIGYIAKFIDQIQRRLLQGEVIAADEKIFSIFEPHTEWISKGKLNKKVELGHLTLITTDQHSFIVDYKVMEKQKDAQQVNELVNRVNIKFPDALITSHSFDKGFWSKDNLVTLTTQEIQTVVLPKRGRHTKEDSIRESETDFKRLRRKHSAVESNINMLEHHGLNRCYDKGLKHFKNCVGLSVLAYNLHQLGNKIIARQQKQEQRDLKRAGRLLKIAA